jgi:hypothetical protein
MPMVEETTAARSGGGEGRAAPDPEAPEVKALIDAAVARAVADLEQAKAALADEKKRLTALVEAREQELARTAVEGTLREAAAKAGLVPAAVEDALGRARRVFTLDEDGRPVARDAEGAVVPGADGEHPLAPAEWLESMKEAAPHWWPPSSGAGAPGAGVRGGEAALSYEQAGQLSPEHYARLRRERRIR